MAKGIDVHPYYQRGLNWDDVSGIDYVWVKVTDGGRRYTKTVGGVTYYPKTVIDRAKSRGLFVGGYCYGQPGDGAAHASLLIEECEHLGATGLVPAIDIESDPDIHTWSSGEAISYGRGFCQQSIKAGYRPGVYMNNSMALTTRPDLWPEKPVLWIARYGGGMPDISFDVHQYTKYGSVGGATVDMNESYSDRHLRPVLSTPFPKIRSSTEDDMYLSMPASPKTTGTEGMIPTPVVPTPGEGRVRVTIVPSTEPVYLVEPKQIIHTGAESEEIPLDGLDRVFPGQVIYATLNADALAVRLPYSSKADFKIGVFRMD